jgi:ABC-type glycerol-3-phosphate transport system substrate-binding protein
MILLAGCGSSTSPAGKTPGTSGTEKTTLRLLLVDDPALADVVREQWRVRSSDDELEVRTASSQELVSAQRLSADAIIFPASWMGELVERELIQPIPDSVLRSSDESNPALLKVGDLLPTVRQCDASWGRKLYAVTLGSPQLVLLYRPDIFEKLDLKAPTTWAEYQAAVDKLADRTALGDLAPTEGESWHAALEPTAAPWAGISLLARAASAVRTEGQMYALFDLDAMSPRIASPPFVRAAQEMAQVAKTSGAADQRLTPQQVRDEFFAGHCGMAITWPSSVGNGEAKTPVAFAELPGRAELFSFKTNQWVKKPADVDHRTSLCGVSGRLAAVTREARRSRSAFALLAWLDSDESLRALRGSTSEITLSTRPQLADPAGWVGSQVSAQAASQYATVVDAAFSRAAWMPVVRLPGADAYRAALDEAVTQSLADPEQAETALAAAAKKWDEITRQHDISRQRRAYQRSLGNDF